MAKKTKNPRVFKTELYEMDKPSSLIHTRYGTNKQSYYNITANQFDMLNFLGYSIKRELLREFKSLQPIIDMLENEPDKFEQMIDVRWFKTDWRELTKYLGRYSASQHSILDKDLTEMQNIQIRTNVLGKNKETGITTFSMIRKYTKFKKHFSFKLEPELLAMYLFMQPYTSETFATVYLKIQSQNLSTVPAKRIYETLKDYSGIKVRTFTFNELLMIMNLDPNVESNQNFGTMNRNHLSKAIKEINDNTDILVSYELIKEKVGDERKKVTEVRFTMDTQSEERLRQLGLIETESNPFERLVSNKAEELYESLPSFRKSQIQSKDAYIKGIIAKDSDLLKNMVIIDEWIIGAKDDCFAVNPTYQPATLVIFDNTNYFTINNNYLIVNIETKLPTTNSATATLDFINSFSNGLYTISLMELGYVNSEWTNVTINIE